MSETITVGCDGSPESQRAILWAAEEASRRGAAVTVVGCYTVPTVVGPWVPEVPFDESSARAAITEHVAVMTSVARHRHHDVPIEPRIVEGSARDRLIAEAEGSSLLVIGASGASAVESRVLGSVAKAAAHASPCPVVVVPRGAPSPHERVVVGVDGAAAADAALTWAVDEADRRGAELLIVHAWTSQSGPESIDWPANREVAEIDASLVINAAIARAVQRGHGPVLGELVEGPPAKVLLDRAAEADMVVLGSRRFGAFRSMLFGSVAHAVCQRSPSPVVIVHEGDCGVRVAPQPAGASRASHS